MVVARDKRPVILSVAYLSFFSRSPVRIACYSAHTPYFSPRSGTTEEPLDSPFAVPSFQTRHFEYPKPVLQLSVFAYYDNSTFTVFGI